MSGTTNQPLVIRADASTQIGSGHIMRCLALAQAWQDVGGHAVFTVGMTIAALEERLRSEGMEVIRLLVQPGSADDAIQTADSARQMGANWVVVDGYHFGVDYQQTIRDSGLRLLFVDDNGHAEHYYADVVLNQNIHAHEGLYANREPYTRLLLGIRYVLLRREFLKWWGWKREIPEVARKVLVTLGGGDPDNVTFKVLQALQQVAVDGLEAVVVVGGSNPYHEELQSAIRHSPFAIRLERNVTNMPELMAWADVAVSAGGSTCWELAFMGLPNLVLILADNQRPVAERLDTAGVAVNLGWRENLSSAEIAQVLTQLLATARVRMEMSWHGQQLVDGQGVNKVLRYIRGETISLRQVREDDCRLLWEWANDPDVREASFSSESISWEQHVKWFKSKLSDPRCIFYIAMNSDGVPIGQVRYDREGNKAVVSISIDREFRGKGYGSRLIWLASQKLFVILDIDTIHAYVKQGNEASVGAFVKAGYEDIGATTIRGYQAIHLILQKWN
jgi:UDP-2,4-diacetamido-2,4,6-trideoxy-beta-L-altropyranose hydrolase